MTSKARTLSDFISDPTISTAELKTQSITHNKLHPDIQKNIPTSFGSAGQVLTVNSGATAGVWEDMADAVITVSSAGSNVYKFTGDGFPSESGNNPDMYFERGKTYCINNSSYSSHPLAIRVSDGGSAYTSGVTGASSVKVTFTVPMDAPNSLVYQCTNHSAMVGNIYITGKGIKGYAIEVVASLPGSPDANTIYFVTG